MLHSLYILALCAWFFLSGLLGSFAALFSHSKEEVQTADGHMLAFRWSPLPAFVIIALFWPLVLLGAFVEWATGRDLPGVARLVHRGLWRIVACRETEEGRGALGGNCCHIAKERRKEFLDGSLRVIPLGGSPEEVAAIIAAVLNEECTCPVCTQTKEESAQVKEEGK